MNITMNSAPLKAGGDATVAANGTVAGAAATPADGLPLDPAQIAASGIPAAMPFLQFMDLNAVAMPAGELPVPELASADPALQDTSAPAAAPAPADAAEETTDTGNATLLAAMAMPLMPSMMMAMPAALPAGLRLASGKPEQQASTSAAAAVFGSTAGSTAATSAAGAIELPLAATAPHAANAPDAALPAQAIDTASAQLARASAASAQPAPAATSSQPAPAAVQAQPRDGVAPEAAAQSAGSNAGFGVAAPAAPSTPARDGGTLTLAGPPTAWRQSLQEALGDRLNLQLTKNAEQAVIRLEPPMLGRVEISIRHSAGALEVNITATHSEVLRQLNTVGDNLRSDLAGRQYTDVSVNISQATPRAQAAAQAGSGAGFGADAQGRGRQQDQEQDERTPGAALAEAHHSNTSFSLSGRA